MRAIPCLPHKSPALVYFRSVQRTSLQQFHVAVCVDFPAILTEKETIKGRYQFFST